MMIWLAKVPMAAFSPTPVGQEVLKPTSVPVRLPTMFEETLKDSWRRESI